MSDTLRRLLQTGSSAFSPHIGFSAAFQHERKVTQWSHRLKEAKFLQRCGSVHFINGNRSFNFGRPDRGQPITTAEWQGLSFPRSEKLIYLGWQLLRASLFPQFWSFCYRSDKLTLYPVTSDSFSIALTCSQFRKIFELVSFHSIFDGGRFGAEKKTRIMQTMWKWPWPMLCRITRHFTTLAFSTCSWVQRSSVFLCFDYCSVGQ